MTDPAPANRPAQRFVAALFWAALVLLALFGAGNLFLVVAGMVEFNTLGCGPRYEWTEENYIACSDIDETNPIFFGLALITLPPLPLALLIRWIRRRRGRRV